MEVVDHFEGREIQTWVYRQDREAGFFDYAIPSKHVLEFYSDYVGPFAYEKLANIQSNSVGGGMEAASAIFYGDNSVVGDRNTRWRNVIIHEIAHQWFGNAVTEADWDHVWLSEGITTYFTLLFREHAYGRDDFVDGLKDARRRASSFQRENQDYRIVHHNLDDMSRVSTGQTYQKGAWIMHMLRARIGDDAFQEGIRSYYQTFFNANAVTDDLLRHMGAASGQDLGSFFRQWLYQGGHVILDGGWSYADGRLNVDIAQVQTDGYSFDVPVEIGVFTDDSATPEIHTVELSGASRGTLVVPMEKAPLRVVLDPRTVLLAEWTFEGR
jgi:aminopeptidase N